MQKKVDVFFSPSVTTPDVFARQAARRMSRIASLRLVYFVLNYHVKCVIVLFIQTAMLGVVDRWMEFAYTST
jgi:hypothetical protein